jgi:hypothetical protein
MSQFARAPRRFPQTPGCYEQNTKVPVSRLKDRGLILTRIVEAGGDIDPGQTITLEEYHRRDVQWTQALYNELYGPVDDHGGDSGEL